MTVRHIRGMDGSIQFIWVDDELPRSQYERYMDAQVERLRQEMDLFYGPARQATLRMGTVDFTGLLGYPDRPVQVPTIECTKCRKTPDEMSPVGWKQTNRGRMYCVEVKCHGDCEELQIFHTYVAGTQGTPKIPAFGDWV